MTKEIYLNPMDVPGSNWAEHYATRPYMHFKSEVYPLFCDVLENLKPGSRILDIGAGPGHLAYEFYQRNHYSAYSFVLLDSSSELLRIAIERLDESAEGVEIVQRSLTDPQCLDGLGEFNAIVSNNVPYPIEEKPLQQFFASVYSHLAEGGIYLYQYPFGYYGGTSAYGNGRLSSFLKDLPAQFLPEYEYAEGEQEKLEAEKAEAVRVHDAVVAEAKARGAELPEHIVGWQPIGMENHLELLTHVGFECGCIWRKRNFGVVLGVK